jgi:hypothetical protein
VTRAVSLADRDRFEAEVAQLQGKLDRAASRLDSLRTSGPEPRGLLAGVLVGGLVVLAGMAWFAYVVSTTTGAMG